MSGSGSRNWSALRTIPDGSSHGLRSSRSSAACAARWAGIERTVSVTPGHAYLLSADVDAAPSGDLVYIGRWLPSEVTSLSGGSSGGVVEPASRPAWFPGGHGFIAATPSVRVLFYSEGHRPDFTVHRVAVARLRELTP